MPLSLQDLQNVVLDALEDIKGQNILVFDAQPLTSLFDRVIIASGTSNRQTRALAKNLHDKVKQSGGDVYGAEGEETGEWVLVDLGDIIVHIMQPAIRDYYRLEEIWGKHPIDWQAERALALQKMAPRRKPTAKKPISEKTPAKKAPSKKVAAKKSPAKKPAAKNAAAKKPKK
jgi:ribosome-associated protein